MSKPAGARGLAVLDRLRARTRPLHDAVERDLDWQRRVSTLAGYRALLARWWGFHATFEPEIAAALERAGDADLLRPRRKLHLLRDDLLHLGMRSEAIEALPLCSPSVAIALRAEALGALYVVEGSTLGGQVIARHVRRALGPALAGGGLRYFTAYGARTGAMWRAFCDELATEHPSRVDALLDRAEQTFAAVREWHCNGEHGVDLRPLDPAFGRHPRPAPSGGRRWRKHLPGEHV